MPKRTHSTSSRRTLIFGSDGLRPDVVDPDLMPTYCRIMAEGTRFTQFFSVFPSETRVAMSSFTTGVYPGKHGIVSNRPYLPGFGAEGYLQTGNHNELQAFERQFGCPVLLRPTLGDRLAANGKQLSVAGSGSSGCNLLWNLQRPEKVLNTSTDYGVPELAALHRRLGPLSLKDPFEPLDWITSGFIEHQLEDETNAVMVLWLAQPDKSAHGTGLGSPEFRQALRHVDHCLARVLEALHTRGEEVDLLLLSDHGHSTIDAKGALHEHFLSACATSNVAPEAFAVSGQSIFKQSEVSDSAIHSLLQWMKDKPWCGSIYLHHPCAEEWGALPIETLLGPIHGNRAPLFIVNPTWTPTLNRYGVHGISQLTVDRGYSTHGNAVPTDMQAFCVGWGPNFKQGYASDVPAGIIDIAPTLCHLHGIAAIGEFDGRILHESLTGSSSIPSSTFALEGEKSQRQPLQSAHVERTRYIIGCQA